MSPFTLSPLTPEGLALAKKFGLPEDPNQWEKPDVIRVEGSISRLRDEVGDVLYSRPGYDALASKLEAVRGVWSLGPERDEK